MIQKLDAHRGRTLPPIPGLPPGLAAVLARMTAKPPGDRYQAAAAVAEALDPFASGERGCVSAPSAATSQRRSGAAGALTQPRSPRSRLLVATGVLFAVTAAVAGVVIVRDKDGKEVGRMVVPDGGKVEVVPGDAGHPPGAVGGGATQVREFFGHTEAVYAVALSADGKLAVSAGGNVFGPGGEVKKGSDYTIRVWDAATGKQLHRLAGHTDAVASLAFSPDGRRLASGGGADDRSVRTWDLATGKAEHVMTGHESVVQGVAFAPDGGRLVSVGWASPPRVWDVATGREAVRVDDAGGWQGAAWAPDGRSFVAAGWDVLAVFDAATGKVVRRFKTPPHHRAFAPANSADGRRVVAVTSWDQAPGSEVATVFDAGSGEDLFSAPGLVAAFQSADGNRVLVGDRRRGRWAVWDVTRNCKLADFPGQIAFFNHSVATSADGRLVLFGGSDGTVRLWRVTAGDEAPAHGP